MVDDVFSLPLLEPPAGGLARLLSKRDRMRPWRRGLRVLAPMATAALLLALFVNPRRGDDLMLRQRLAAELDAERDRDIHVENGAAMALPITDDNIRIYVVMSTQPVEPRQ